MKYGIRPGLRVGNHRCLDRWPSFSLEPGYIGTIVRADPQMIAVRMDVHMPGAEEWNNEFQLTPDDLEFTYEGGLVFDALEDLFHYFFSGD
jgi:hypothetical protein